MCLDNLVAKPWAIGDKDFQFLLSLFLFLVEHPVVAVESCLALCLPCLWCHANPFELAFEGLAPLACHLLFLCHAASLLVEPRGVVAFPGYAFATVEFQYPSSHVVEEVSVVGDGNDGALVLVEMLFEPVDALCVKVVGWLVKQ